MALLVVAVITGNMFPIIDNSFIGKPIIGKADTHVAIVKWDSSLGSVSCPPEEWGSVQSYTEIVCRDDSQVLPLGYIMVRGSAIQPTEKLAEAEQAKRVTGPVRDHSQEQEVDSDADRIARTSTIEKSRRKLEALDLDAPTNMELLREVVEQATRTRVSGTSFLRAKSRLEECERLLQHVKDEQNRRPLELQKLAGAIDSASSQLDIGEEPQELLQKAREWLQKATQAEHQLKEACEDPIDMRYLVASIDRASKFGLAVDEAQAILQEEKLFLDDELSLDDDITHEVDEGDPKSLTWLFLVRHTTLTILSLIHHMYSLFQSHPLTLPLPLHTYCPVVVYDEHTLLARIPTSSNIHLINLVPILITLPPRKCLPSPT